MPTPVISVEHLSKRYLVGHHLRRGGSAGHAVLREAIARGARNAARKAADIIRGRQVVQGDQVEEFWALKDVSFDVNEGEVLGIIGRNGAGKSTLLKVLSRITEPTSGRLTLRGRVSSLLEVGTGFHPELSGGENIYLNGAILGMTRTEIRRKFDEIVAFAEIDKFIDTPVKRYSSGMYVRLAFAVAAHLEPEVLIVDEVLAVGDAEFQKKCLGKMNDVSQREGRTVLLVSHNMAVIGSLCSETVWLDGGSIRECGPPRTVVAKYLAQSAPTQERLVKLENIERRPQLGDDRLRFAMLEWRTQLPLQHGEPVNLRLHFKVRASLPDPLIGIGFNSSEGGRILTYNMDGDFALSGLSPSDQYSVDLVIDSLSLPPGQYTLDVGCRSGNFHTIDFLPECCEFEVIPGPGTAPAIARGHPGVCLRGEWALNRTTQAATLA